MAYEYYDINDIKRNERPSGWFARVLISLFGYNVAQVIYGICVDIAGFFMKVFHFLTLPFMFFYFFLKALKKKK